MNGHRVLPGVEQDGVIPRVIDQRAEPVVIVKTDSRDDLAVGKVQAREPARGALLVAVLLRVHEENDPRPRLHRRLRRAETAGQGPPASVAGLADTGQLSTSCR